MLVCVDLLGLQLPSGCCAARAVESVCRGRVDEPLPSLRLIENHNMLKFSFVLCWGLGNMPFSIHSYSIITTPPPSWFGSMPTCVTENFVLKCVFLLDNCFQLLLYWARGSVLLRSSSKIKSDVGTALIL